MKNTPMVRLTTQRQIILEELCKVTSHPTASEIYDMVRKRLPRIGLGTVYRNLELMAENGVIAKIDVAGNQRRFDGNTAEHYHARCLSCGCVQDIDMPIFAQLAAEADNAAQKKGFIIVRHHVEFVGFCADCSQEE